MRSPHRTALFASLLAIVCAGVLWAAYDWFQGRYLRAFSEHTAVFSGDPLRLPGRQRAAAFSYLCFVAVRQIDDEVMNARRLRRRQPSGPTWSSRT